MTGFGLSGNLDFFTGLDFVAVLEAVGALDVLDADACFLGYLSERFALLNGDF